ncbi:MAG: Tol-Pal system beta propeller repeat protein TolB [Gammaproteobacteria bacterium]|nr:Tol-Pal system beta propeller repeat protein TolB [Gammaproteobacteria bacterium]
MQINKLIIILFLFFQGLSSAQAVLKIEITQGMEGATPIAIVPFDWVGSGLPPENINQIIAADLQRSGFFSPLPEQDMISRPGEASQVMFADWRALNVDYVVVGRMLSQPDGTFQIQFQLMDVHKGKQMAGYSIRSRQPELRTTAHQISDIIYKTVTDVDGAFDTHIAYITVTQNRKSERLYRLAIADADGHNEQIVFESSKPLMSPSWSPDGKQLAYVSFTSGRQEVYVQNVITRESRLVSSSKGLNGAPVWSPDGKQLALTLSKDGNPEIYVVNLSNNKFTRITRHYAIDTEATWMPDGKGLIFTSDRGGSPQLYQVELNRQGAVSRPKRITFDGNYNARASVSPDGKRVAMVHRENGRFTIAVQSLVNGRFQVLTTSRLDESPSFSPNGSMIIYATEDNYNGVLAAVSVDGRAHQRLSLQSGDVREPAWSPFK